LAELTLPERVLFISDLHLQDSRPDITRTLFSFLQSQTGQCDALYVLGDLFEVWIGDDDESELASSVAAALQAFNAAGAAIYIMHGNRDFLIGADYASRCGATLVSEPLTLITAAGPVLLMHGDQLCTDDTDYMQFRETVRQPAWQTEFLAKPLSARRDFARQARQQSQTATAHKQTSIMDVNQTAVVELMSRTAQTTLLHGHTHRPAIHEFELDVAAGTPLENRLPENRPAEGTSTDNKTRVAQRVVLGDWDQQAWYVETTKAGLELNFLPLQAC
jgi:UDP-2,3-diacylglucosamine hydrolase